MAQLKAETIYFASNKTLEIIKGGNKEFYLFNHLGQTFRVFTPDEFAYMLESGNFTGKDFYTDEEAHEYMKNA